MRFKEMVQWMIRANATFLELYQESSDRLCPLNDLFVAFIWEEADGVTDLGEPQVSVPLAQGDTVLGAGGEHAVGLGDAFGDEVIDHHSDERLPA